ncbi:hypothetical protein Lser_V15G15258 [Lactuca serriola]
MGAQPLFVLAGPNVIESEEHIIESNILQNVGTVGKSTSRYTEILRAFKTCVREKAVESLCRIGSQMKDTNLDLLHPLPPPEKSKDDILLFFKLYDPMKEELHMLVGFFVKSSGKATEITSKLNERAGFCLDEEIELYEEIKFETSVMCERLDKRSPFRSS